MTIFKKNRGDTMIEVLVTALILAIGVLGAAAMQLTALRNLNSSYSGGTAEMLTNDISERMRANESGVLDDKYLVAAKPTATYIDCTGAECDSDQLAGYDVAIWYTTLEDMLPGGVGRVAEIGTTDVFQVTVYWDDDRSGSTGTSNCPPASKTDLDCYQYDMSFN